jgi:hypothetical protein
MSVVRSTTPPARRVIGYGALAGVLAVAVNLAVRGAALALLREPVVPFPLAAGADVVFSMLPCVLGACLFLFVRRRAARPLRVFTVVVATVLVASWAAPAVLAAQGVVGAGALVTLLVMHAVPAAVVLVALRVVG